VEKASSRGASRKSTIVDGNSLAMSRGRIAYQGPLGSHDQRILGGVSVYAAGQRPFTLTRGTSAIQSMLEVVAANEMHAVNSHGEKLTQVILEPETIENCWLENLLANGTGMSAEQITRGFGELSIQSDEDLDCQTFDRVIFGSPVPRRDLDRRIRRAVEWIVRDPANKHSAEEYARNVGLSVSRFSHLFRSETGATLRGFCAWKRVRGALALIGTEEKLIETALSAGYADSTHFCHAIRQFFGRRPRDIFSIVASGELTILPHHVSAPAYSSRFGQMAA
jgi:AraC-like DNA-binding protein